MTKVWVVNGDHQYNPMLFSDQVKADRMQDRLTRAYPGGEFEVSEVIIDAREVTNDMILFKVWYRDPPMWFGGHWDVITDFELMEAPFSGVEVTRRDDGDFGVAPGDAWETWVWAETSVEARQTGKARITNAMAAKGLAPIADEKNMVRADTPFINAFRAVPQMAQEHVMHWGMVDGQVPVAPPRPDVDYQRDLQRAKMELEQAIINPGRMEAGARGRYFWEDEVAPNNRAFDLDDYLPDQPNARELGAEEDGV